MGGGKVFSSRFWPIAHCALLFGRCGVHQITSITLPTFGIRHRRFQLGRAPIEPSKGRAHGSCGDPRFGSIASTTLLDRRGRYHQIVYSTPPSILLLWGRLRTGNTSIKSLFGAGGDSRDQVVVRRRGWESAGADAGTGLVGDEWYGRG